MKETPRIVALVLAAGYSSRMNGFKPLASLGESTLIEEAVGGFFDAGVGDVRVVVGHRAEELTPVLRRLGVRWIVNADYGRGMFSSVLAGVRSLEADVDGFFLLPCDIALVKPETIRILMRAFDPCAPKILYPRFNGQRGHPPLIPAGLLGESPGPDHPGGLRAFLARYEQDAVDVDVADENILLDCDTPSDYGTVVRRRAGEALPTERECEAVWSLLKVSGDVIAHSILVAELARMLAVHLNMAGMSLSIPLIVAAGRLHDIAKGRPDHAGEGARLLAGMGYPRVGSVVARHSDIESRGPSVDEADLVFFADKRVAQDRLVSLEERFAKPMGLYGDRPEVANRISRRLEDARSIARRIEAILHRPVDELIGRFATGLLAPSLGHRRTIWLIRHGAIQPPGEPKRFIGQLDPPLHSDGLRQADLLAEVLRDVPLSTVFCSDLRRSVQTAQAIARAHGLPCIPKSALREIALGRWEGMSFDEVRREYPDEFRARGWDMVHCPAPGGESFLDCTLRVVPAFHNILNTTRGDILIVGHAGVNRVILSQVLGRSLDSLFEIKQEYGCLNLIVQRYPAFEVKLINGSPSDLGRFQAEVYGENAIREGKAWRT